MVGKAAEGIRKPIGWKKAGVWGVGGIVLLLAAVVVDLSTIPAAGHERYWLAAASIELLKTLGATVVALSLLNIVLETEDWRAYFEERLSSILLKQEYMNGLDEQSLKIAQFNLLKAQFKNAAIEREGSFLTHYNEHIHSFIGGAYRESVASRIFYTAKENGLWTVVDNIQFTCRKNGGAVQSEITWSADEADTVRSVRVEILEPNKDVSERVVIFDYPNKDKTIDELRKGLSISKYADVDGLLVSIAAEYDQEGSRFSAWGMSTATKGISITVSYPPTWSLVYDKFVPQEGRLIPTKNAGFLNLEYAGWLLPEHGFVWQLSPIGHETAQSTGAEAQRGPGAEFDAEESRRIPQSQT